MDFRRRIGKFRYDLQDMKLRFEATKKQQEVLQNDQNRDSLLRRSNRLNPNLVNLQYCALKITVLNVLFSQSTHTNHYLGMNLQCASNPSQETLIRS